MAKKGKPKPEYITVAKRYLCPDCLEKLFCPVCGEQKAPRASLCKNCRRDYEWLFIGMSSPCFNATPRDIAKFYRGFKALGVEITPQLRDAADRFIEERAFLGNHPTAVECLEEMYGRVQQLKLLGTPSDEL